MVGIDISGFQADDVPGNWEFIVVKSTEGNSVTNPRVAAQWANALRTRPGLYHYARPAISDGVTQANIFASDALARGFKPGEDLWQLDAEDGENAGVTNWAEFVDAFMLVALERLGPRGFLYAGWPFVEAHGLQSQIGRYMWWLPAYGPNDGQVHPFPPGTPADLVVIHQFTSFGNLDQNRIVDEARYNAQAQPPRKGHEMFQLIQFSDAPTPAGRAAVWSTNGVARAWVTSSNALKALQFAAGAQGLPTAVAQVTLAEFGWLPVVGPSPV